MTFLLNSLGHDRPRSDPLFIKIYAMDSCRVDSVRFLVSLQAASCGSPAFAGFFGRLVAAFVIGS